MAIKVGQRVKDTMTGRVGIVIKRISHEDGMVTCAVNPKGVGDVFLVDEWRLQVADNVFAKLARIVGEFIRSEQGSSIHVKAAVLAPYVYGLITGVAVMLFRCKCS